MTQGYSVCGETMCIPPSVPEDQCNVSVSMPGPKKSCCNPQVTTGPSLQCRLQKVVVVFGRR